MFPKFLKARKYVTEKVKIIATKSVTPLVNFTAFSRVPIDSLFPRCLAAVIAHYFPCSLPPESLLKMAKSCRKP